MVAAQEDEGGRHGEAHGRLRASGQAHENGADGGDAVIGGLHGHGPHAGAGREAAGRAAPHLPAAVAPARLPPVRGHRLRRRRRAGRRRPFGRVRLHQEGQRRERPLRHVEHFHLKATSQQKLAYSKKSLPHAKFKGRISCLISTAMV